MRKSVIDARFAGKSAVVVMDMAAQGRSSAGGVWTWARTGSTLSAPIRGASAHSMEC